MNEAYKQAWLKIVEKYLANDNGVLSLAANDDALAINKKVWLPVSGGVGDITRGRTPGTKDDGVEHTEDANSYDLMTYHTDAKIIDRQTADWLSFQKLPMAMEEELANLKDTVADWLIYQWYENISTKDIIRTTGASRAVKHPSQTGNRNKITFEDVQKAAELFDYERVKGERYLLIDPYLYGDLVLDERFEKSDRMAEQTTLDGLVGEICGFKVIKRAGIPLLTGDTANTPDDDIVVTDALSALAFTSGSVRKALTDTYMYVQENDARHAGHLFRMGVNAGSSITRLGDKKGVVIIGEDTP